MSSTTVDKVPGDLLKSFNLLKSHATKVADFTLQWQDLDDYLRSIDASIQSRIDQLQSQHTQLDSEHTQLDSKDTQLIPPSNSEKPQFDFGGDSTQLDSKHAQLDSKDTQLIPPSNSENSQFDFGGDSKLSSQVDLIGTQVVEAQVECQPECLNVNGVMVYDGKALVQYMNDHYKEKEIGQPARDVVSRALREGSEIAGKLVLEALGLFCPGSCSGNGNSELIAVRRSCVVLLEELMMVRPLVRNEVREEAVKFALDWKAKMKSEKNSLELYGFLMIVGVFGLVGEFDRDEILKLFGIVAVKKRAPELLKCLGFADTAPAFIHKLISEKRRLDAIRFINAFELLDKFPHMPLIKEHVNFCKKDANMSCKKEQDPLKAQDEAIDKEIVSLKNVVRCIESCNLGVESQYSPENLRKRIIQLKSQKRERKATEEARGPVAQGQHLSGKKRGAPDVKDQHKKKNSNKHSWTDTASATRNASFRSQVQSMHPSYPRPANKFESRGGEYFIPSAGVPRQTADFPNTSYGPRPNFNSLQPSHHQQTGSYKGEGAEYAARYYDSAYAISDASNSLPAGRYGLAGSSPVTHSRHTTLTGGSYEFAGSSLVTHTGHTTLTAGAYELTGSSLDTQHMKSTTASYGLGASTSATSQLSPITNRYGTSSSLRINGRVRQFGSAGNPPPARLTNLTPNSSNTYVLGDPLWKPANHSERPVSSSSVTQTNQYKPSIYHL